jgi:ribosomal protein L29
MNKNVETLKNLNPQELAAKVEELRREYFMLKLNAATAHIKDYSQFQKLRRSIARALTYLNMEIKH